MDVYFPHVPVQLVHSLRYENLELSSPHRMVPHGLLELLQHQKNSEESHTEVVMIQYLWQWDVLEPSSPHRVMGDLGQKEILGQQQNSMGLPTETVHMSRWVTLEPSSTLRMEQVGLKELLEQR
jgi:hypothetical protein